MSDQLIIVSSGTTEFTAGLLGAVVKPPFTEKGMVEARLAEIERRILAIEDAARNQPTA